MVSLALLQWLLVYGFFEYTLMLSLPFVNAPGSLRGAEGGMAMAAPPRCSFSFAVHQTFSLGPSYTELPATTEWSRRRHSSQGHKGGLWTLFLKLCPPSTVVGWLLTSCGDDAARHVPACVVAKGATGLL